MTAFEALVQANLARRRAARQQRFGVEALQWLAIVPEWTDELARAVKFPAGDAGIEAFVQQAADDQLCTVDLQRELDGRETTRFRMTPEPRRALIEQWTEEGVDLLPLALHLADAIDRAATVVATARGVGLWAQLAKEELAGKASVGDAFVARITRLIGEDRDDEIPAWLYAGESLEPLLGDEMSSAVARAKRRLNLHYGARRDREALHRFLEREEQVAALDEVLFPSGLSTDAWALHLVGMGGVGKTMLVRYLMGPYGEQRGGISAARLDFDRVDPRYPTERPGELIQELAEGLSVYVQERTHEQLLRTAITAVRRANAVAEGLAPTVDPLAALRTDEFEAALSAFTAFVDTLPKPVVLVLDTCEELAKLHPAGECVPSVEATFELVERLHAMNPAVRVVFAGRRLLTAHGSGWELAPGVLQPASVMSLGRREYLKVYEVKAFDEQEACRYLTRIRGLPDDRKLLERILTYARHTTRVRGVSLEVDFVERYNPFDLSLLADWLQEDPGKLIDDAFATPDVDAYVTVRIVDRLTRFPDVLKALPAAVLLGRFDAATLEAALPGSAEQRRRTVLTLAEQEWVSIEGGAEIDAMVLEIECSLLTRLRDYYASGDPKRQRAAALRKLRPVLRRALAAPPDALTVEQVDAALRILPHEEAVEQFDVLAERVAESQAWPWAEKTCGRLLAVDRDEPLPDQALASVRALYAVALQHRGASAELAGLWTTVAEHARDHPDEQARETLVTRAMLGWIAATLTAGGDVAATELDRALERVSPDDENLSGALLRVSEAVLDAAEVRPDGSMSEHATLIARHLGDRRFPDPTLDAFARIQEGRAYMLTAAVENGQHAFAAAARMIGQSTIRGEQCYADWVAPASPRQRLLLEQLRHALAARRESAALLDRCQASALNEPSSLDAARLLSMVVHARLARGPLESTLLDQILAHEAAFQPQRSTANAHRATTPLFVAAAEALHAVGRTSEALMLVARREATSIAAEDEELVREAAAIRLRLHRQMRLDDGLAQARELSSANHLIIRREALAAASLIAGEEPPLTWDSAPALNAAWRATTVLGQTAFRSGWDRAPMQGEVSDEERAIRALDLLEHALVRERLGMRGVGKQADRAAQALEQAQRTRRGRPNPGDPLGLETMRLQLRAYALDVQRDLRLDLTRHPRMVGLVALEEGELLGLRLPEPALRLLTLGERQFELSGDVRGAFVAALRAAIACIHAGRDDEARRRHSRIKELMEVANVRRRDERGQMEAEVDPWRGWIERYEAYRSWCASPASVPSAGPCTELRLEEMPRAPRRAGSAKRVVASLVRLVRERLSGVPTPLFGATVAAFLLWAVNALPIDPGIFVISVALIVFTITLGASPPGAHLVAWAARLFPLDVRIAPAVRRERGHQEAIVAIDPSVRWPLLDSYRSRIRGFDRPEPVQLRADPFIALPRGLRAVLAPRALRPRTLRIWLTADVATEPWEARLIAADAQRRRGWTPRAAPLIWRRAQVPRSDRMRSWGEPEMLLIAAHGMQPFFRRALDGTGMQPRRYDAGENHGSDARAALLIGTPIATGSGWRLRLEDELLTLDPSTLPDHDSSDDTFFSPQTAGRLAPFVIVQAPPGGETPVLDRQIAGGLRGFANEASAAGAYAVLAIPSLPPRAAQQVLSLLADELAAWDSRPRARDVAQLVKELRDVAFQSGPGERHLAIRLQVAFDICLYVGQRT